MCYELDIHIYVCKYVYIYHVCGIHMYLVSMVVRKRHRTHRTRVTDIHKLPHWCWEWSLSPARAVGALN